MRARKRPINGSGGGSDAIATPECGMPPAFNAVIFGLLAVVAAWSILHDLQSGVAQDDLYRFSSDANPIGYLAIIGGKLFVVGFGIATIFYACGLAGDPLKAPRGLCLWCPP